MAGMFIATCNYIGMNYENGAPHFMVSFHPSHPMYLQPVFLRKVRAAAEEILGEPVSITAYVAMPLSESEYPLGTFMAAAKESAH